MNTTATPDKQHGFVLITSLIFLVVVTLLAVSAINSSTLQEKIAANTQARELANQLANAALRDGEALLAKLDSESYQAPGGEVTITSGTGENKTSINLKIWRRAGMFESDASDEEEADDDTDIEDATRFLSASAWKDATPYNPAKDENGNSAADDYSTEYYVAEYGFHGRDLNPDTAAVADGKAIYRITARSESDPRSAVAVTQSRYAKYY